MDDSHEKTGGDKRDYKKWIGSTLYDFFKAYYNGDRLKLYSFFDTDFQREVPLNIFTYHPDYANLQLGQLIEVLEINLSGLKNKADIKILVKIGIETISLNIKMKKEFGNWKILSKYII